MTCIPVNLHQAFDAFFSALAQHQTDPLVLDEIYQKELIRLNHQMDLLIQLASAGMEEQLSPLLSTLLQEWAMKEAIEMLLRYPGCAFDPADLVSDSHLGRSFVGSIKPCLPNCFCMCSKPK